MFWCDLIINEYHNLAVIFNMYDIHSWKGIWKWNYTIVFMEKFISEQENRAQNLPWSRGFGALAFNNINNYLKTKIKKLENFVQLNIDMPY